MLGKGKLSTIEVLISKALMDCYISLDEFVSISNVLREYYEMKEGIKHLETYAEYTIWKHWGRIMSAVKKYTANKNSSVQKTKQNRLMLLLNCARKNHLLEKNKELCNFHNTSNDWFKMNKIANTFFLTGDKFMPELHLKQPRFTYSACGSFTKHRERIRKFRETGNLEHLYRNELDKACFAYDAGYCDSKDLAKRTISGKILKDRAFEIARNHTYDGYQRALTSMAYKGFNKKTGAIKKFKRKKSICEI